MLWAQPGCSGSAWNQKVLLWWALFPLHPSVLASFQDPWEVSTPCCLSAVSDMSAADCELPKRCSQARCGRHRCCAGGCQFPHEHHRTHTGPQTSALTPVTPGQLSLVLTVEPTGHRLPKCKAAREWSAAGACPVRLTFLWEWGLRP